MRGGFGGAQIIEAGRDGSAVGQLHEDRGLVLGLAELGPSAAPVERRDVRKVEARDPADDVERMNADVGDRAAEARTALEPRGALAPFVGFLRRHLGDLADGTAPDDFPDARVFRLVPQFEEHRELRFGFRERAAQALEIGQRGDERLLRNDVNAAFEQREQLLEAHPGLVGHAADIGQRVFEDVLPLRVGLRGVGLREAFEEGLGGFEVAVGDRDDLDIAQQLRARDDGGDVAFESEQREFHRQMTGFMDGSVGAAEETRKAGGFQLRGVAADVRKTRAPQRRSMGRTYGGVGRVCPQRAEVRADARAVR